MLHALLRTNTTIPLSARTFVPVRSRQLATLPAETELITQSETNKKSQYACHHVHTTTLELDSPVKYLLSSRNSTPFLTEFIGHSYNIN